MTDAQNSADNSVPKKRRGNPDKIRAHQFKPGQSGNPGGRPKSKPITEILEKIFSDAPFVEAELRGVLKGKSAVAKVMLLEKAADRLEGKVTQPLEVSGELHLSISERMEKARKRAEIAQTC